MTVTLAEIAEALGAEWVGQGKLSLKGASEPSRATPDDLALAMDASYADDLQKGSAVAAVLWIGADWQALGLKAAIFVDRPRFAMAGITATFAHAPEVVTGVHPSAVVHESAVIERNVSIGPLTVVGARARICEGARLLSQVTISEDVEIGANALIHSGVRIGARVRIGAGFIAHYNAVVGGDGFSFVTPEPSAAETARATLGTALGPAGRAKEQAWHRIASVGSVTLGDNVELGACATIDKGTIADTTVGSGTKIDNHVQIGHNVTVGKDCLLCAHAAVAGSSVLGDRVVLGGQSGVGDHLVIGDDVVAAGATAILSNVPAGRIMMGYPAMQMTKNIDAYKALRRLPRLVEKLSKLQEQVSNLTKKT